MKKVTVVTGTRAEYGLLKPVIKRIMDDSDLELRLVVTGMHLCPEFGLTYKEIEEDGIPIHEKIEMVLSSDTQTGMTKSIGMAMISFADYFARERSDMVILLGDRYEIFAAATAAAVAKIPIAHLYGGDTTEGAVDEFFRHSITKMSTLHFTSTAVYKKRVEQLGEQPQRVFNVGALGIENILNTPLMNRQELEESIGFKLDMPYAVMTFHPATLDHDSQHQLSEVLEAISSRTDMKFIITKANSDTEGRKINQMIDKYAEKHANVISVTSLGFKRYLSALKYCEMVIGNSSSGIYEAPSFHIPTINIGDRQKGRLQSETVINCRPEKKKVSEAIELALSKTYRQKIKDAPNPYEGKCPSKHIIEAVKVFLNQDNDIKKKFYDIR